jgi:hypothetical protein
MDEEHQAHHKSLFPVVRGVIYLLSAKNLEEIGQPAGNPNFVEGSRSTLVIVVARRPWQTNSRQLSTDRSNPKLPNPWHCATSLWWIGDCFLVLHKIERTAFSDRVFHIFTKPFLNF